MKHLAHLNKYLWHYKWLLLGGIFFLIGSNYLKTLQPVVVRWALDFISDLIPDAGIQSSSGFQLFSVEGKTLLNYALILVGLTVVGGLFLYFTRKTMIVMSRLIEKDLRNELFDHYFRLDQKFYRSHNTGDLMSRITEDVAKVRMYLGPGLMYTVNLVSVFGLVIYSMLRVSPELTFWVLIPLPFLSISIYYVSNLINKRSSKIQAQLSFLTTLSQEFYSGIRVLKSFAQEKSIFEYFNDESEHYKAENLKLARIQALFFPLMILMVGASTIICIFKGGQLVMDGKISNGNIAEFIIYVNMLSWPVTAIGWIASLVQQAAASQERINQFLKTEPEYEAGSEKGISQSITGQIKFDNVSFTYPETGIEALKNVSLNISAGERVLIIGRTGSGKTSLLELLLGVYPPSSGEILIDNEPLQSYELGQLRRQLAYVPQDVFLFSDTIHENIAFGMSTTQDDETIRKYARYSSIEKEISELKEGFETMVGERGITLSGGQKQRISLARALITKPQMVILDDALSAIDANAESKILDYLNTELRGKTSIMTAHRVYPKMNFDQIFVLDEGRIVESGRHEELVKNGGYYQDIYHKQLEEDVTKVM